MDEKEYRRRDLIKEQRKQERIRKVRRQRIIWGVNLGLLLVLCLVFTVRGIQSKAAQEKEKQAKKKQEQEKAKEPEIISFTISAAGDCTLGIDENFYYPTGLPAKYEQEGAAFFFEKVKPIFEEDDLTIVNMEGTLTDETARRTDRKFCFKGDKELVNILTEGSVEAANLANNHTEDYGKKSYTDTIEVLEEKGISVFGNEKTSIVDVKGIKVGLLGTYELAKNIECEDEMIENIEKLKNEGAQLIIASFHWGIERENIPNETQIALAHSAIDHGADLVLGHHPHVLQGIEEYNGKNIIYSLANFCFGGNSGPRDMDTMIFQQTFTFKDGKLQEDNVKNIIPCKISSVYETGVNNYQPMPAEGEVGDTILARIQEYSDALE